MRTRSILFALVAVLALASAAQAQTPVTPTPTTLVAWDPSPVDQGVTEFKLYADGAAVATVGNVPRVPNPSTPFPALTPGQHTLEVTARNGVGESAKSSALIVLVIVTVPDAPTNIRIITARWTPETGWTPTLEIV